jgi:hypothetical protein
MLRELHAMQSKLQDELSKRDRLQIELRDFISIKFGSVTTSDSSEPTILSEVPRTNQENSPPQGPLLFKPKVQYICVPPPCAIVSKLHPPTKRRSASICARK